MAIHILLNFIRSFQGFCALTIQSWWRGIAEHVKLAKQKSYVEEHEESVSYKRHKILSVFEAAIVIQKAWRKHIVWFFILVYIAGYFPLFSGISFIVIYLKINSLFTFIHACTHMQACTHASMHAHTHARKHARTHARTHACLHTRTHARTHAHTHTHTHTCTHAHIHTPHTETFKYYYYIGYSSIPVL